MRRVSWNGRYPRPKTALIRHASHEACELKWSWQDYRNFRFDVTPRMRRVSWNISFVAEIGHNKVTPRMRRVSWNVVETMLQTGLRGHASHEACELKFCTLYPPVSVGGVTPRMRRVSWNINSYQAELEQHGHASHEACELKFSHLIEYT